MIKHTKAELDRLWIRTRARLYMHANGATTNYDGGQIKHEKPGSRKPVLRHEEIVELEKAWAGTCSRRDKERVIWAALIALFIDSPPSRKKAALPFMPPQARESLSKSVIKQTRGTQEWKIAVAFHRHPTTGQPFSLRETARTFGISHEQVRKIRREVAGIGT